MTGIGRMDWQRLLSAERLNDRAFQPEQNRSVFVQDHDRIIFSPPFRRLANKTQVHPLYENDHVHNRLIHSIEVSSVGRSLAMRIGDWLVREGQLEERHIHDLADITQAACVAHDIGNPPFGHSGEASMGDWFAAKFDEGRGFAAELPAELQGQFTAFEGNAQGFRILARLENHRGQGGMRLSKATLAAFTKYPVTDSACRALRQEQQDRGYAGLKKYGIFNLDLPQFQEVAEACGLLAYGAGAGATEAWRRHPLVFLMEAADDITYNIVDLEDAFVTGELAFETVRGLLYDVAGQPKERAIDMTQAEMISWLRSRSIGAAIEACIEAFIAHYQEIMAGTFARDLIGASRLGPAFGEIRALARQHIFNAPRKTELEVAGRRIVTNVLDGLMPVYEELARKSWIAADLSHPAQQLVRALSLDLRDVCSAETALHSLADFTSGMTDRYALRIAKMLSGVAVP